MSSGWRFLVDENLEPDVVSNLEDRGLTATHVLDALFEGADDFDDVLPYARSNDCIVVTSNITDFKDLPADAHEGIILLYDGTRSAHETVDAITNLVEAYPGRDEMRHEEPLDDWF